MHTLQKEHTMSLKTQAGIWPVVTCDHILSAQANPIAKLSISGARAYTLSLVKGTTELTWPTLWMQGEAKKWG